MASKEMIEKMENKAEEVKSQLKIAEIESNTWSKYGKVRVYPVGYRGYVYITEALEVGLEINGGKRSIKEALNLYN